jgi:hypothetical protein
MNSALRLKPQHERIVPRDGEKKVGGSLRRISPLRRIAVMQQNALFLRGGKWRAPADDGSLVRKVVGKTRKG